MSSTDNTPDISGMIEKIMQNPEFAGMVKELRGDGGTGDVQGDIMSKLPEVMAMLSPMLGGQGKLGDGGQKEEKSEKNSEIRHLKSIDRYDKTRAMRLMSALKPYLSPERCTMIDKCMSVLQLGDVMTVLRGLDGLNKTDG